jgi:hypothetical protein
MPFQATVVEFCRRTTCFSIFPSFNRTLSYADVAKQSSPARFRKTVQIISGIFLKSFGISDKRALDP